MNTVNMSHFCALPSPTSLHRTLCVCVRPALCHCDRSAANLACAHTKIYLCPVLVSRGRVRADRSSPSSQTQLKAS